MNRQELFNYFSEQHGINLLDGDMNEVERIVLGEKEYLRRGNEAISGDVIENSLGSYYKQYTIWHDGGEWLIGLKGKEQEECKTLKEWLNKEIITQ